MNATAEARRTKKLHHYRVEVGYTSFRGIVAVVATSEEEALERAREFSLMDPEVQGIMDELEALQVANNVIRYQARIRCRCCPREFYVRVNPQGTYNEACPECGALHVRTKTREDALESVDLDAPMADDTEAARFFHVEWGNVHTPGEYRRGHVHGWMDPSTHRVIQYG